ncbi:MAG: helix-turn-helix domain-containing protein [Actinomycetota bacterium]
MDDRWKSLGEFIRTQRRLADMSLRQLANVTKVSNPYLSQIERGIYKPSAEVLKAIADALKISAESLYARVGLLDARPPQEVEADRAVRDQAADVERSIRLDADLSAEQKSALLRVYRSFVASDREAAARHADEAAAKHSKQGAKKTKRPT